MLQVHAPWLVTVSCYLVIGDGSDGQTTTHTDHIWGSFFGMNSSQDVRVFTRVQLSTASYPQLDLLIEVRS